MVNKGPVSAPLPVPRWALPPSAPAPSPIDFSKLLDKLLPPADGEDMARLRTGIVDSLNSDGTANVGISGLVIPNVPVLAGASIEDDRVVNILVWRGGLLVIGSTARSAADRDRAWGNLATKRSTAANTTATSTLIKDSGCGDLTFTAVTGRRYRWSYRARFSSNAAGDTCDVRILDGGGSSPTSASTARAGSTYYMPTAINTGSVNIVTDAVVDCPTDITAGTHIVAAFFVRVLGSGTVTLAQATGQTRTLTVDDIGPVN